MQQDPFDITTVLLLAAAAFVAWRLYAVLGQRGDEPPRLPPRPNGLGGMGEGGPGAANGQGAGQQATGQVIPLPTAGRAADPDRAAADRWAPVAAAGTPLAAGLDAVAAADGGFDAPGFLGGARAAYEMIVTAFARGDRKTLKDLLSRDVFEGFALAIGEREGRGESVETTFVSIDKAELIEAQVKGRTAHLTVRFVSKLVTATRDRAGAVADGDPEKVADVTDIWTFAREAGARDPNWRLVATEAGA